MTRSLSCMVLTAAAALGQAPQQAFELASIHRHQGYVTRTEPLTVSSPLIRMEGYTVFGLVMDAYHLRDYQLAFGAVARPDDVYDTQYDIIARAPGKIAPSLADARAMLQTLLADRFKLRVHRETKEMQVYGLVVGKNGPRLKAASASGQCSVHVALAGDGRNNEETFSSCPIERLADRLTNIGDRPVLDQTGLAELQLPSGCHSRLQEPRPVRPSRHPSQHRSRGFGPEADAAKSLDRHPCRRSC